MREFGTLIGCLLITACGGGNPPAAGANAAATSAATPISSAESAPGAMASSEPAASAAPEPAKFVDPRVYNLAKINKVAYSDDVADDYQRARIIASGLSEQEFGLDKPLVDGLAAVVNSSIGADALQCGAILRATVFEISPDHTDAECGDSHALDAQLRSLPREKRSEAVAKQCKFQLPPKIDLSRVDPWALLIAMSVRGDFQDSEELDKIIYGLVYICDRPQSD